MCIVAAISAHYRRKYFTGIDGIKHFFCFQEISLFTEEKLGLSDFFNYGEYYYCKVDRFKSNFF